VAIDLASRAERQAVTLANRPDMIAVSPDGATLYVTLRDGDKLLMISAADLAVRKEVATGVEPHGVAYRPTDQSTADDADRGFARGMISHHQGAIDMARVVLEHGEDPELRALAQAVIAAQGEEIAALKAWLARSPR
jgi:YVTN family beta-propeller protein